MRNQVPRMVPCNAAKRGKAATLEAPMRSFYPVIEL